MIVIVCVVVAVVGAIGFWLLSDSEEDLLAADPPSPRQIRRIASELLFDDEIKTRARAKEKLISLGEMAVPVLKEVSLDHSDPKVRQVVLGILAKLDKDATVEVLDQLMGDENPQRRELAASAAKALGDARSATLLEKALSDPDVGVRMTAAESLRYQPPEKAVPALRRALKDPDPSVRRHAARALMAFTNK